MKCKCCLTFVFMLNLHRAHRLELDLINLTGLQEDLGKIVVTVHVTPKAAADGAGEVCFLIFNYMYPIA